MHNTNPTPFRTTVLLLTAVAALSGCGDRGMFSRGMLQDRTTGSRGDAIDSTQVTVSFLSSRCGGNGVESCLRDTAPAVEVHIDGQSVIFDFSNVAEPGVFPDVEFEGFLLEVAADSNAPIHRARVDGDTTNLDIADGAVIHDETHLEVNLAGVAYDSEGLIKIDLLAGTPNLLGNGE
jgi:hypothetical protein